MQEDKEAVFDAFDTAELCLAVFAPMIATMKVNADNMLAAAKGGYINATDLADYLAKKGVPFRTAYKLTGQIVADCAALGKALEDLTLAEYKAYSDVFEADLYDEISLADLRRQARERGRRRAGEHRRAARVSEGCFG